MKRTPSAGDLQKVYRYSEDITKSRDRAFMLLCTEQSRGAMTDKRRSNRMARLRVRLTRLTLQRKDEIMRVYSHGNVNKNRSPQRSPKPRQRRSEVNLEPHPEESPPPPDTPRRSPSETPSRSPPPIAPLVVTHVDVQPDKTTIEMVPQTFQTSSEDDDDEEEVNNEKGIFYPEGVTDYRPYRTIARYRRAIGESTDFREKPLMVGEDSLETLILGLESFAQQHNCDLSFTNEDQQFDKSVYRAACGLVDLGSIHLLATDSLLSATFEFEVDLDYDQDITSSKEKVERFAQDFCRAISEELSCDNSNVRVFSIEKLAKKSGRSHVNFGLTTSDHERTRKLADKLQTRAQSGFSKDKILKHVKPRDYQYTWKPVLTKLQIRPGDLDPRYNFDYRRDGVIAEDTRGSHPYYLPIGWFRHGLNVSTKYADDQRWIGHANIEGEWPVAFHGTAQSAVPGIVRNGLLPSVAVRDAMLGAAVRQMGEEANRPGLYVATHCNGGSDLYTTPFEVITFPDKKEQFRIVFQCRVQPGKFTTHTIPVNVGHAWRIVDPNAVRPYGLLLKKEKPSDDDQKT